MSLRGGSAIVTGAGSGIGRALSLRLASQGCRLTLVDIQEESIKKLAEEISEKFGTSAISLVCDITKDEQQKQMFEEHVQTYKSLNHAILNAGVLERGDVLSASKGGQWESTLDINLRAQIVGARFASLAMQSTNSKGVILFTSSAGGIFPMPPAPVYSASKGGLISFAESISPRLINKGIRVCTLCPQFADTPLVHASREKAESSLSKASSKSSQNTESSQNNDDLPSVIAMSWLTQYKLLTVDQVVNAAMFLIEDNTKIGTTLLLRHDGKAYEWTRNRQNLRHVSMELKGSFGRPKLYDRRVLEQWARENFPPRSRLKVQVQRLTNDFRAATKVVQEKIPTLKEGEVLVRRMYAGVNASDVNFTSGRYFGKPEDAQKLLPFDAGFEAVGVISSLGPSVKGYKIGDTVAEMTYGGFSQWGISKSKLLLPVPTCAPEIIGLLTGGLTASIGLEIAGQMSSNEKVLVTAAAGGTGQFVVQLAKLAGNHVIATCGGEDKADLLRKLGADRVINYRKESIKEVLKTEYPKGVNLIWESVGGEMFDTCVRALSDKGRIVVIGMMSQYGSGWKPSVSKGLLELLLTKSATVRGFFLIHHTRYYKKHLSDLAQKWMRGQIHVAVDPTKFIGEESCVDAVEHLQSGKSVGKVVVQLPKELPSSTQISRL